MRTTLTLDEDVAQILADEVHRTRRSMKDVVNAALRQSLGAVERRPARPYRVRPWPSGPRPGIDVARMNQLVDELEVEAFLEKETRLRQNVAGRTASEDAGSVSAARGRARAVRGRKRR